jgi:hypothetical protein
MVFSSQLTEGKNRMNREQITKNRKQRTKNREQKTN